MKRDSWSTNCPCRPLRRTEFVALGGSAKVNLVLLFDLVCNGINSVLRGMFGRCILGFATALAGILLAGCGAESIDRTYGKRRGEGGASVNGTAVLAGMFTEAGFRVSTWRRLSPKLEDYQVIVWAPDDFQPPSRKHRAYLERWLADEPGRTLVYIGRDYDAAVDYWREIRPGVPPEQAMEADRRLATVQSEYEASRTSMPEKAHADWFTLRRDGKRRKVETLEGPWAEGIDASQVGIEIAARLEIPSESETEDWMKRDRHPVAARPRFEQLLISQDDALVTRITRDKWGSSQLLVVHNGSFLLNLPLVNHEHRKLAGKLIRGCSPAEHVVFLESGPGGPPILEQEPNANYPTGLELFTTWPLGVIVLHMAVLGIAFCFALYPIFGRPHELPPSPRSDFGKHIAALGEFLERTRDRQYAVDRVKYYQEHVRRDSGVSHRREKDASPSLSSTASQLPDKRGDG